MSKTKTQSFLDRGAAFEGKISFHDAVKIDGHFRGEAQAPGTLVVGESGVVVANLRVGCVVIHGTVEGDVTARERIEISATGRVSGTLRTPALVIAEGALVTAKVEMQVPVRGGSVQPDVAPPRP